MKGFADITLFGPDGNVKDTRHVENLITTKGFDGISQRGFSTQTGSAAFNYIAIGSGTTAASTANTTLGSEAARAQGTYAHTDAQANLSLTNTFAAGTATGSINEYGVLNAAAAGQLMNRATFGTILKGAADSLQLVVAFSLS